MSYRLGFAETNYPAPLPLSRERLEEWIWIILRDEYKILDRINNGEVMALGLERSNQCVCGW